LSALTGIAIRENYIQGTEQKVVDFFPDYFKDANPQKKSITIHDLLNMTAGLKSLENNLGR
jgi:CubicO group peptidase (beta-lactamase class C family)